MEQERKKEEAKRKGGNWSKGKQKKMKLQETKKILAKSEKDLTQRDLAMAKLNAAIELK